jgi:hypothetical protein
MTTMVAHKTQYGVKFVGYSAWIIARKYGREVEYAQFDFVSGYAFLRSDCGSVKSELADLGPLVKSLPDLKSELQALLSQHPAHGLEEKGRNMVTLSQGQNTVCVAADTDVSKFIRQITKRFFEIEQVLEQAEKIGSEIQRRPYSEYIAGIRTTELREVEYHGFALLVDGKLLFYPDYRVAFVKAHKSGLYELHSIDHGTKINSRSN